MLDMQLGKHVDLIAPKGYYLISCSEASGEKIPSLNAEELDHSLGWSHHGLETRWSVLKALCN